MKSEYMFLWLFFYISLYGSDTSSETKTIAASFLKTKTVYFYQHNPYVLRYSRQNNRPIPTYTKRWNKIVNKS